jgi:hypothetical protein
MPRIDHKIAAGFVGIFIPVQKPNKTADTKAASHFQEKFMTSLSRSVQIIPQVLRYTLRSGRRQKQWR